MRASLAARGALALALGTLPSRSVAQDLEMMSHALRRPLPAAYRRRIARDPRFYTWPGTNGGPRAAVLPPRSGVLPILVIPALFADSPAPTITPEDLQRTLFDGPSASGTLTDIYREISGGKLQVRGRVLPWVRTTITLQTALGADSGFGEDAKLGDYLRDALIAADASADFGEFDDNGPDGVPNSGDDNGIVDAVVLLFPERPIPCGGTGPWPQLSGWGAWFQDDLVFHSKDARTGGSTIGVSGFIMTSASACVGSGIMSTAILAHELGHVLGVPDLYDASGGILPESRRWIVGCWDLMSAGAWGCGNGAAVPGAIRPTHYGAWSKERMGWLNAIDIGTVRDTEIVLHAARSSNEAARISVSPTERFMLEYRERTGFDGELPSDGVIVWHIDDAENALHQVMVEEADGNGALLKTAAEGGNRGEAGDAFGASARRFSAATRPTSQLHDGRATTTFTIHTIAIDAANHLARVRITTDPQPLVASTPIALTALTNDRKAVRVSGGAEPYVVTTTDHLPNGLSLVAAADDVLVAGAATETGTFAPTITVRDALGTSTTKAISITVAKAPIDVARLLQPLLATDAEPLTTAEASYLDANGNKNGQYDVGDLRAYLQAK